MEHAIPAILVIFAVAALAPFIAEATRRIGLSVVVIEILLGVAIGPQGLGWANASQGAAPTLAIFGMGFLFFVAGMEIDLYAIRAELKYALLAWVAAFVCAYGAARGMRAAGLIENAPAVAIALATTALGVLVPILKDAGVLESPFGRHVMAAGVMGELGPIVAMSLALSTRNAADIQAGFTLTFIAVVAVVYWASSRILVTGVLSFLRSAMLRSGQLPVRIAVLLMVVLAVLAEELGVDLALGALAAGMIIGLALRDTGDHAMHHKLEAIAFGFVVPVFFIVSGMKLDVRSIFADPQGLALLAAAFVSLVAVRIPGVLLYRGVLGGRQAMAHALYSATTLSLIVAITGIAVAGGLMKPSVAAPLVGAGMLTVLLFPAIALPLAGLSRSKDPASLVDDRDGL
jgi:Kef-type K+ transport system membrane component KefB